MPRRSARLLRLLAKRDKPQVVQVRPPSPPPQQPADLIMTDYHLMLTWCASLAAKIRHQSLQETLAEIEEIEERFVGQGLLDLPAIAELREILFNIRVAAWCSPLQ